MRDWQGYHVPFSHAIYDNYRFRKRHQQDAFRTFHRKMKAFH